MRRVGEADAEPTRSWVRGNFVDAPDEPGHDDLDCVVYSLVIPRHTGPASPALRIDRAAVRIKR